MSVGGVSRSPATSITDDDDDLEQQELEQQLYMSALQAGLGITNGNPTSIDDDPNDPSAFSSTSQAAQVARPSTDSVSAPSQVLAQTTQKVIGMNPGGDPMLAVYAMEAQHDRAPEPNVVQAKDNA